MSSSKAITPVRTRWVNLCSIAAAAICLAAPLARGQTQICVNTNTQKFLLPPQTMGGLDVKDSRNQIVLADDFFCNTPGPITDIHVWASWLGDQHGTVTNFWIGIYNDIPAVTNFPVGQIVWSHPGTNLLWFQNFGPGQFSENFYTNGDEQFYDPATGTMAGDTLVWYYCFRPASPFLQQGTPNAPTNYWLAIYAQLLDSNTQIQYGWKSSAVPYNDPAVWGLVAGGFPIGNWQSMTNPVNQQLIHLSMKLDTTNPPPTQCLEANGAKYVQWPNVNRGDGADVWDCNVFPPGVTDGPWMLADDFVCTNTGPITDIHLWGSWQNDKPLLNSLTFQLYVMDDVPISAINTNSHPGTNIFWHQTFLPGSYSETIWSANATEYFLDPGPPTILGGDGVVWYYCFNPTNLIQYGSASMHSNYWLVAFAELPSGTTNVFGWKTTTNLQNDISVHTHWPGPGNPPTGVTWTPTYEFGPGNVALDLAFKLTTPTNQPPPPPVPCADTNIVKYVQWPDQTQAGIDVWNSSTIPPGVNDGTWVLADDFICTNTGPITDIHVWGSWMNDFVATNMTTFWIGLFDDMPTNAANLFSHPGNVLWQECFGPNQYVESLWSFGLENFMDPGPPSFIGTDDQIWYYCFNPTNPPTQQGTTAAPRTYWLAVYAQLPAGISSYFGWKTTTNVQHDVSVHSVWPATLTFCPTNLVGAPFPVWTRTTKPSGGPLDLAFQITTRTNCIVPVACAVDKTVQCGSAWSFDPPFVGPDPCCPNPPVTNLTVITNSSVTCTQLYTGIWTVTDACNGQVLGVCTQHVAVIDTTPPILYCSNLTAYCPNKSYTNPPAAYDLCCGSNVFVSLLTNFMVISNCGYTVYQTWQATDCCLNTTQCVRTVIVLDTNPPAILCPSNIVLFTCGTNPVTATWPLIATNVCSSVTVTSSPPPGFGFLPNTTNIVLVSATNGCGVSNFCTFTVSVRRPVLTPLHVAYYYSNIVVLQWSNAGILQCSTNVFGQYLDVPSASSPYTNTPWPGPPSTRFYRLRCPSP